MSRSDDAGHFFQTTEALATTERRATKAKNKYGAPIKLPSKLLAAHPDEINGSNNAVYVAEAAGEVKRVVLESGKIERIFSQANAPLTCLAVSANTKTLFTGSWSKDIFAVRQGADAFTKTFTGHTDFVKCLLVTSINNHPILLSGSADATIIVWDLSPENYGKQLHKLKGHVKAIQDLAIDPLSLAEDSSLPGESFVLFTASSDREIRRWFISLEKAHETSESLGTPIRTHETSVYKLRFDSDGDLWTASADKTARHLVRTRNWAADTVLPHPDFVRDVLINEQMGLVITACRDEEVRVWDATSEKLICTYTGHFDEVTALAALDGPRFISVSIDGTLRQWSLERSEMQKYQDLLAREANGEVEENADATGSKLTAEEEAELAELMEDDD